MCLLLNIILKLIKDKTDKRLLLRKNYYIKLLLHFVNFELFFSRKTMLYASISQLLHFIVNIYILLFSFVRKYFLKPLHIMISYSLVLIK